MIFFKTVKSGVRHLLSQKLNSTVHITGLALGITVCLLISLFIKYELSFDTDHPYSSRTFRVNEIWTDNGERNVEYSTQLPLAEELRRTVSGLDHVAFAQPVFNAVIDIKPDKRFQQTYILFTDPVFLDVFSVDVIKGKGHETLRTPYHALISESTAKKFFGSEDPVGKTFTFRSRFEITVGGVFRDIPSNTHLPANILLSYVPDEGYLTVEPNAWNYTSGNQTYVVLPEGYDKNILLSNLKKIADVKINSNPEVPKFVRTDYELIPLTEIHFDLESGSLWIAAFHESWLWFFGAVALSVLLLACINFVNLSAAQSLTRAKEVGVRKSIGAGKGNLLLQFLGEAWILAAIAGVIAVGATELSLPFMNDLLETKIEFEFLNSADLFLPIVGGIFLVGLMAGIYPAWIIAKFSPAVSLRSGFNFHGNSSSGFVKRALIVIQFTISAGMLIALVLISQQVDFIRSMNLGFNKQNMIIAKLGGRGESAVFSHELEKIADIEGWSYSTSSASAERHWGTLISKTNGSDPDRQGVTTILGDENYAKLYGFRLLAGRSPIASDTNFISSKVPEDQMVMKALVNEKLLDALDLGTPDEAIGKHFWFGMGNGDIEVIGVVADFNTRSVHEPVKPTIIGQERSTYSYVNIRLRAGSDMASSITAIEAAWRVAYPEGVFSSNFLDDQIDNFYKAETRINTLFKVFTGMAMLISCLGLWGLITFTAQQKLKEISIRKVLGARASSIVILLSRDFIVMVLGALIIASPLVYYGVSQWLSGFAFRIPIGWSAFATAGIVSLGLAFVTVGVQALKAWFMNPASILKSE
jgi:putative ABC transport system permease protein